MTILEGADQEVPDWLAKEAEKAPGGAGATKGFLVDHLAILEDLTLGKMKWKQFTMLHLKKVMTKIGIR